jgi:plasmid stability protein
MCYGFIMKTITLKDVPPALHQSLKARAREHGRSLNREILVSLESLLRCEPLDAEALAQRAREAREAAGVYVTRVDLAAFKDKGRS